MSITLASNHSWNISHVRGLLIRDLHDKFGPDFDAAFADTGTEVIRVGPRAPNLNAYAERWVLSIKSECLDHFVVFGEKHLRYLIDQYVAHYLTERPHQGKDNLPLTGEVQQQPASDRPRTSSATNGSAGC
jgi:transposase InsO family protein